jgi:hypothetical protein
MTFMAWIFVSVAIVSQTQEDAVVKPSSLAPGPQELTDEINAAKKLNHEAAVVATSVARLQNRLAEFLQISSSCEDLELRSLLARAGVFAQAHRDRTQSARMQHKRLERLLTAKTLEPLLDPAVRTQLAELHKQTERQVALYQEFAAWHKQHVAPLGKACQPTLAVSEGLADPAPRAPNENSIEAAVLVLKGGFLCPQLVAGNNQVVIANDGIACFSKHNTCDCHSKLALPGAVFGP